MMATNVPSYARSRVIHLRFSELDYALEIFGRGERLRVPALSGADAAPAGHYLVRRCVAHEPWSADEGPARIELADLDEATVSALIDAGRAKRRSDDDLLEIDGVVGAVGGLKRRMDALRAKLPADVADELAERPGVSIRGGGGADPGARFQPLEPPPDGGLRVHNADLVRLVELLFGGSAAVRAGVFSVVGEVDA